MDGIGFFTLDSTFFWLVVIFSSFDSVFVYIGLLVLVIANIGNILQDCSYNDQFLKQINIIILIAAFLCTEYPKVEACQEAIRETGKGVWSVRFLT
jgi:hypothetical protein